MSQQTYHYKDEEGRPYRIERLRFVRSNHPECRHVKVTVVSILENHVVEEAAPFDDSGLSSLQELPEPVTLDVRSPWTEVSSTFELKVRFAAGEF